MVNNYYTDICLKCQNKENCYVAKILSDSDEFDEIELSNCVGFATVVISKIICIKSCKECPYIRNTESSYYCIKMPLGIDNDEEVWRQIYDEYGIHELCPLKDGKKEDK